MTLVLTGRRHSGMVRRTRSGISRFPAPANARPGMTAFRPSLARPGILDVEFAERTGNHEIIIVEHQRARDAVLEQFELHRVDRRLLAVAGFGVAVVIAHRYRPARQRFHLLIA